MKLKHFALVASVSALAACGTTNTSDSAQQTKHQYNDDAYVTGSRLPQHGLQATQTMSKEAVENMQMQRGFNNTNSGGGK